LQAKQLEKREAMLEINNQLESVKNSFRQKVVEIQIRVLESLVRLKKSRVFIAISDQRGDVPGWVLVVLMTTGLVTAIWTIAAPRLTAILKNSLDAMNGIR
jgi:hypothetical protein